MRKIKLTEAQLKYCIAHSLKEQTGVDIPLPLGKEESEGDAPARISKVIKTAEKDNINFIPTPKDKNGSDVATPTQIATVARTELGESYTKKDFEKMRKRK